MVLEPDAASALRLLPRPWRVAGADRECSDVVTLTLSPPVADDARAWQPGQFNMLYAFGVGEVPVSLAGHSGSGVQHTIREVGPVTRALSALRPGDRVGVRGPFGTPWPVEAARSSDVLIIAGGIGLAPLRPVIEAIGRERDAFGRVALLYGTRTPAEQLYAARHALWREHDIVVETTVDHADAAWPGHVGVVTTLVRRVRFDGARTHAFLCGPEIMMRFAARELAGAGVDADRVWVSMERNMQCAIGHCGHCQLGAAFVCTDGPVFSWARIRDLMAIRGL